MEYTKVHEAADVTDEVIKLTQDIHDGWYAEGRIDWHDFIDRLDGRMLDDGSKIDLGDTMDSPAIKKIQAEIRAYRKLG